jgi:membrane-associated phospholipid phosphatase
MNAELLRDHPRRAALGPAGALLLGLALALNPVAGRAQDSTDTDIEYDTSVDLPVTLVGVAGALAPRFLTDPNRPWTCRWCDRDAAGDDTLNGLDAWARRDWRWADRAEAHKWSNVTLALSFVAPTSVSAASEGVSGNELLIVLEASAVNMALTQGTKYLFRRTRPWAHDGDPPPGQHMGSRDSVLSFVSGHASLAFAMAVSTGSLASLKGDDNKEWVWATGLTFAAATSYLRVAADRHYLTDVLAGAAVGAAVGWGIPRLVDRTPEPTPEPVVLRPTSPMPAFTLGLGGAGPRSSGVVLGGGLHHGGPFLSASWSFR